MRRARSGHGRDSVGAWHLGAFKKFKGRFDQNAGLAGDGYRLRDPSSWSPVSYRVAAMKVTLQDSMGNILHPADCFRSLSLQIE